MTYTYIDKVIDDIVREDKEIKKRLGEEYFYGLNGQICRQDKWKM